MAAGRIRLAVKLIGALAAGLVTGPAIRAEVSLINGLFTYESFKSAGHDAGRKTTMQAGGRYSEPIEGRLFWFGQGDIALRDYAKGDNPVAPSNSTSLTLGGGVRYYFSRLADHIEPFVAALGQVVNSKDSVPTAVDYTETEKNGLYYGADFGIRLSLQKEFFVDLEVPLFSSALYATEKTTKEAFTPRTSVTSENTQTQLFAQTTGNLTDIKVALGMRF